MSGVFARLAAADQRALELLRDHTGRQQALVELMHTSCLLELSKLAGSGLDLATFGETVVNVLSQFFPLEGCLVQIGAAGLPGVEARQGRLDGPSATSYPLVAGRDAVGVLAVRCSPAATIHEPFFAEAAAQVGAALDALIDMERLRRQAAAATAVRLAASFDELSISTALEQVVDALAAIGSATGATLDVAHQVVGAPLEVRAGVGAAWTSHHHLDLPGGTIAARVSWAASPDGDERATIDSVLEALAVSVERCAEARRLREEVEVDPLTGVGNRRRGARVLAAALARAERQGEPVAVLAVDLDQFKRLNDRYGHPTGDAVLQAAATLLVEHVRLYDTVVRTGGDEFLVICPGADKLSARALAERLRQTASRAGRDLLGPQDHVGLSIGVAVYPDVADHPDALVRAADEALYEAKGSGRDAVAVAGVTTPAFMLSR